MKSALALAALLGLAACGTSASAPSAIPLTAAADSASAIRDTHDVLGGAPRNRALVQLQIALFDAPIPSYPDAKVNVALAGIQLLAGSTATPFADFAQPQVINLIALQNQSKNFDGSAPEGTYSGIRLLIDTAGSNVTIGRFTIPIVWGTPGHPNAAPVVPVDFSVPFTLAANGHNGMGNHPKISLDFNVLESVKFADGRIYVQPSVIAAGGSAQAQGKVCNAAGKPVTNATVLALDTTGHVKNTTVTATDGSFTIHALAPGQYTFVVKNSYVSASGQKVTASGNDAGAAPFQSALVTPDENIDLHTLTD